MSANLKIVSDIATADVKLDVIRGDSRKLGNGKVLVMKDDGSPKLVYKDPTGKHVVRYAEVDVKTNGIIEGRQAIYIDEKGNQYQKAEILPFYECEDGSLEPATKNEKTEVFEVKAWEPVENYLDRYQMDRYYQVRPSPGLSKKDYAKQQAIESNTAELYKLWKHMHKNEVVARGALNITSAGYLPSVGYLRAVALPKGRWTFEMAVFRENKPFDWSEAQDWKPSAKPKVAIPVKKGKTNTVQDI